MIDTVTTPPALYHRSVWQKELEDNKIDMGLLAPISQDQLDHDMVRAVVDNHRQGLREMVALGANVNRQLLAPVAGTPLHLGVEQGSLKMVVTLLQLGADPFAVDAKGRTARALAMETARAGMGRIRTVLKLWEQRGQRGQTATDAADRTGTH